MKTQLPLPYSDMRGCLSKAERRYVIGEGLSRHLREKRYKHRALAAEEESEESVGGFEATVRPGETRERERERERESIGWNETIRGILSIVQQ